MANPVERRPVVLPLGTTLLTATCVAAALPLLGGAARAVFGGTTSWASLGRSVVRDGAIGLGIGVMLVGGDRLSKGVVASAWEGVRRLRHEGHQLAFVLRHPLRPWLYGEAWQSHGEAVAWETELFGGPGHLDDAGDAFRHAYASASLAVGIMRRGVSQREAARLVSQAGEAHERDGVDNPRSRSSDMDMHNNGLGIELVGSGRDANGEWLTDEAIARRVLRAMRDGRAVRLDVSGSRLVPTTGSDLS